MANHNDIKWTRKLEEYFVDLGERSQGLSWLYGRAESEFSRKSMYFDLPAIILSTLAGSLSLSAERLFSPYEEIGSIITGCLSIFCGVLTTINNYFNYSRKAESSKNASVQYAKLYRFIRVEMSLKREERIAPKDLLKICQEQYERLNEISTILPPICISEYKRKFYTNKEISHPEIANGMDKIMVYGWQLESPKKPLEVVVNLSEEKEDLKVDGED